MLDKEHPLVSIYRHRLYRSIASETDNPGNSSQNTWISELGDRSADSDTFVPSKGFKHTLRLRSNDPCLQMKSRNTKIIEKKKKQVYLKSMVSFFFSGKQSR